jgi:glycosyltransferase involved in cell wall biosynthesis
MLWRALRRRGISHVHVHLNGTAPAVALLATEFANRVSGGGSQTWSMTVHGPDELYDVTNEALPEKIAAASFVVCISDFARSQLMAFVDQGSWEKLHVVHCGVDPRGIRLRTKHAAGEGDAFRVLTVSKLSRRKGTALLLEAIRSLNDAGVRAELTVIGDGPERVGLEENAARLGIIDRVRFLGAVGQDRINRHYEETDAFAMASFAEGVPVVLMEAMAHGLPVVAPAIMGVAELVEDGESGLLVRPARVDCLTDALARLAADAQLRTRLGAAGRRKVEAEFDIRESAARLRDLFAPFVGVGGAP